MPFFFLCIYNDVLRIVPQSLAKTSDVNKIYWQGIQTLSMRELYPGAHGKDSILNLTNKRDNKPIDWENGNVIVVNGTSAPFGDSFGFRNIINSTKLLNICQKFKLRQVLEESIKNCEGILEREYPLQKAKFPDNYVPVMLFFATQPYGDDLSELPDNCLLITKKNFEKYFGPVFSSRATFFLTQHINPNFAEPKGMCKTLDGVGEVTAGEIVSKRPYSDEEDFYTKNPRVKITKILSFFPCDL
ncbi:3412_t:CDS:2 [Ambispora gerdemannii]|uniref:3412_t:CDS:1 n=1 Tax=Ambispora gerdemannii TaxID=144530 RepID=A0A9N8ZUW3_9GLOM|nr:3412_t:CDS:2 [Ambispora gerdemannii]